jgi:sporulation integral membrane protein YtvI
MNLNKQKAFIIHVIFFVLILGLTYVVIKYLFPLLMPFIIGMIVALIFRRLIDLLEKKTRIRRSFVSILVLIVFYGIVGFILSMIGVKVFTFMVDIFKSLPGLFESTIQPAFEKFTDDLILQFPGIDLDELLSSISNSVFTFVENLSSTVVGTITGMAGQLPSLLINLIFTIVSSFFFTIDYYRITRFLVRQFPEERREMILNLKDNVVGTLGKFFKAYATIISITFVELSIGFWILHIPNALLFGSLVAIIDVLPILGTGAVLIPWSVIAFVLGNTKLGIGMLILYIIITVVRQAIEPKIVGQQIGLHPILTLILMYVGTQLMGVLGLLILPIIATILKKLDDEGTINILRK